MSCYLCSLNYGKYPEIDKKEKISCSKYDSVAQLVEQYTFNVWVLGSNPSGITNSDKVRSSKT